METITIPQLLFGIMVGVCAYQVTIFLYFAGRYVKSAYTKYLQNKYTTVNPTFRSSIVGESIDSFGNRKIMISIDNNVEGDTEKYPIVLYIPPKIDNDHHIAIDVIKHNDIPRRFFCVTHGEINKTHKYEQSTTG